MIVYCDMNAVKMDIDGIVKPVPLCHFLRNRWWYRYTKENIWSGK